MLYMTGPINYICRSLISNLDGGVESIKCDVITRLTGLYTSGTEHQLLQTTMEYMLNFVKASLQQNTVFALTLVKSLAVVISQKKDDDISPMYLSSRLHLDSIFDVTRHVIDYFKPHSPEAKPALRVMSFLLYNMGSEAILSSTGLTLTQCAGMLLCKTGPSLDIHLGMLLDRCDFLMLGNARIQRLAVFQACQVSTLDNGVAGFMSPRLLDTDVPKLILETRSKEHDMFPHIYKVWTTHDHSRDGLLTILRSIATTENGKAKYWSIVTSPPHFEQASEYLENIIQVGFECNVPAPPTPLDIHRDYVEDYLVQHLLRTMANTAEVSHKYVIGLLLNWDRIYKVTMDDLNNILDMPQYKFSKTEMKDRLRTACVLYLMSNYDIDLPITHVLTNNRHRLYDAFYQIVKEARKNQPLVRLYFNGFKKLVILPTTVWPSNLLDLLKSREII
jgi:hypothetical protein